MLMENEEYGVKEKLYTLFCKRYQNVFIQTSPNEKYHLIYSM